MVTMTPLLVALLAGCATTKAGPGSPELEARVEALEGRLADLEQAQAETRAPTRTQEREAAALQSELDDARGRADLTRAKEIVTRLTGEYAGTLAARVAQRVADELAVVGKEAGALEVDTWYTDEAAMDDGALTLLVFWEEWCPYCTRYMPQLEQTWQRWADDGLNVIALTRVRRSATDDRVQAFIERHGLTYAVAQERDDKLTQRFSVRGVPAVAVIQDGEILWRGHPNQLSDAMIGEWLGQ